jgi:hypothetical protein
MHILFRLKAAVSDLRCSSPVPKKTACWRWTQAAAAELLQLRVSDAAFSVFTYKFKLKLDLQIIFFRERAWARTSLRKK